MTQTVSLDMLDSAAGGLSFRNKIINGAMAVDQRGTAVSAITLSTSNQYTVDRWAVCLGSAPSGTLYGYQIATSDQTFPYALRLYKSAGSWSGNMFATQVIESINCRELSGQTVTVQFRARRGSDFAGTVYANLLTGSGVDQGVAGATGGTWTGYASTAVLGVTSLTTSFQTFTAAVTIPAGTNEIAFTFVAAHTGNAATANNWVELTGVQIEQGSNATPFERRPYGLELALCQRYYEETIAADAGLVVGAIATAGSQQAYYTYLFKATKRTTAIATIVGTWGVTNSAQPVVAYPSTNSCLLYCTSSAAGQFYAQSSPVGAKLTVSAEL